MRIAVVGATGTVGAPLVEGLAARGHEVRALSRHSSEFPVDLTSGEGLDDALAGCEALVDASNAGPAAKPARAVLIEGGRRLLEAASRAGIGHHVCISIVGIERVPMPYYRIKVEQEELVKRSGLPYTIVRSTQFHELVDWMLGSASRLRLLPGGRARLQPIAAVEAARGIAAVAAEGALGSTVTIAGPEVRDLGELARAWRQARSRRAAIVPLPPVGGLVRALREGALTDPDPDRSGTIGFERWLAGP
jgi:uncharacterized protein YbjT (DUF2867 family)